MHPERARPVAARRPRFGVAVLVAVALVVATLTLGACSAKKVDPATARRQRVEARLRATYSGREASCIVRALDPSTIEALDRATPTTVSGAALTRYTAAVTHCVIGSS